MAKFDFVIGNPPYQDESNGADRNYAPPVYNLFMDEAEKVGNFVELIHPARFLFNAGSTPKKWNEKKLNDPHFKVLYFEADSDKIFPGLSSPIKGGVAITAINKNKEGHPIVVYSQFEELNSILSKVLEYKDFKSIDEIVFSRTSYRLTTKMHEDYPNAINQVSKGHAFDVSSNIFQRIPEVFHDQPLSDGHNYVNVIGRNNSGRVNYYIRSDYINEGKNLNDYKVYLAQASGTGTFGEALSKPIIGEPNDAATETFLSIGKFKTRDEAINLEKYVKTKFLRTMLGMLKVTQNGNKPVWRLVPLQNFTVKSDIGWSASIANIDQQLYKKYGLSPEEIEFIETNVKEME